MPRAKRKDLPRPPVNEYEREQAAYRPSGDAVEARREFYDETPVVARDAMRAVGDVLKDPRASKHEKLTAARIALSTKSAKADDQPTDTGAQLTPKEKLALVREVLAEMPSDVKRDLGRELLAPAGEE